MRLKLKPVYLLGRTWHVFPQPDLQLAVATDPEAILARVEELHRELRERLAANSEYFREQMTAAGFELAGAGHPIIPVMLGDAQLASDMADRLLSRGIYVIGFSYPVVPRGEARIRTQMSAAHTREQIDRAVAAFVAVGRELGVIS